MSNLIWSIGRRVTESVHSSTADLDLGLLDRRLGRTVVVRTDEEPRGPALLTGNQHFCREGTEQVHFECGLEPGAYVFQFGFLDHVEIAIEDVNCEHPIPRYAGEGVDTNYDGRLSRAQVEHYLEGHDDQVHEAHPRRMLSFTDIDALINAPRQGYLEFLVDGRLVDTLELHAGAFTRDPSHRFDPKTLSIPFLVLSAGTHVLTVRALNRWCALGPGKVFSFAMTRRLHATHYRLERAAPPPIFDSFDRGHPGGPLHTFWSYELCCSFMRPDDEEVGPERFREVADESFQWGATHMDLYWSHCKVGPYPPGSKCGHPMQWSTEDALSGAELYNQTPDSLWDNQSLLDFTRYCHDRGLTVDWYQHLPLRPVEIDGVRHDGWNPPETWRHQFLTKIARDFADVLSLRWRGTLDCYQEESGNAVCTVDILRQIGPLWSHHPGMAMAETYALGTRRIVPGILPNFIEVPANSHYFFDRLKEGDATNTPDESEWGRQASVLQANARACGDPFLTRQPDAPEEGTANPDEVLQQLNDLFRQNATDSTYHEPIGIWWLAESSNVLPDELRNYVRGTSMWPVRCAYAMELRSQGSGGALDRFRHLHPVGMDRRDDHITGTSMIGNNYLRIYLQKDNQLAEMEFDPRGLGQFARKSIAVSVLRQMFSTHACDGPVELRTESVTRCEYLEKAGYVARLREIHDVAIPYAGQTYRESRTWTVCADSPWFSLEIDRQRTGLDEDLQHCWPEKRLVQRLSTPHHDVAVLPADNERPAVHCRLRDPHGLLPTMYLQVEGADPRCAVVSPREVEFSTQAAAEENLTFRLGVEAGWLTGYAPAEIAALTCPASEESLKVPAARPQVRVARLARTESLPYFVCEGDSWFFRGAQVSEEHPACDYVIVYRGAGQTASIRPYGFLDDAVRPGWGCQNMLALRNISRSERSVTVEVEVLSTNPMIFAPRLQFRSAIASARVNDAPWHYLDDDVLFLPNRKGPASVHVELGACSGPCLLATYGVPGQFAWDGRQFSFRLSLPPQTKKLPPSVKLYAAISNPPRMTLADTNGEVVRKDDRGAVLRADDRIWAEFHP